MQAYGGNSVDYCLQLTEAFKNALLRVNNIQLHVVWFSVNDFAGFGAFLVLFSTCEYRFEVLYSFDILAFANFVYTVFPELNINGPIWGLCFMHNYSYIGLPINENLWRHLQSLSCLGRVHPSWRSTAIMDGISLDS